MGGKTNFKQLSDKHRLLNEIAKAPKPNEQARVEDVLEHMDPASIPKDAMDEWAEKTNVRVEPVRQSVAEPENQVNLVRCRICRFDVPLKDLAQHLRELHPSRSRR